MAGDGDVEFWVAALAARVHWRVPADASWVRDQVFAGLVVEPPEPMRPPLEPADEVTWHHDELGWRAAAMGDHLAGPSPDDLLPETMIALNRVAAASMADDCLVLHAGAFTVPDAAGARRAVALCGQSGAGKSTATAAATLLGHPYVADEVCAVDPDTWRVHRYLRPIGLRAGGAAALGLDHASCDGEGPPDKIWHAPLAAEHDPQLGLVVLVERRSGPTVLEVLGQAEALELLVQHTLGTEGRERLTFRRAEQLVRSVAVARIRFDDVFDAVDVMAAHVRTVKP
jgi:energy-coupling factor transporter ATP-binding protein EcfA2